MRAHLADGSVIVFRAGVRAEAGRLVGGGTHYDLVRRETGLVEGIGLDSVVALETFTEVEDESATLAASIPLSVVGGTAAAGGALFIFKALFGSCPTIYSDCGGVPELEAEGYSYSIARLFEMRDVDRLRVAASDAGDVRLEVRNEALETHYTDHFGLIEVRHRADETVAPDARGEPVAVRRIVAPASAPGVI